MFSVFEYTCRTKLSWLERFAFELINNMNDLRVGLNLGFACCVNIKDDRIK